MRGGRSRPAGDFARRPRAVKRRAAWSPHETALRRAAGPPTRRARRCGRPCSCSVRSEEHTSELQSPCNLVCRLLLEKKKKKLRLLSSALVRSTLLVYTANSRPIFE